jgi:hypothetical protein
MSGTRRKPNPDGISANIAGTASRHAGREPLDVDAAIAELREVAGDRSDLLAERAGIIFGFRDEDERDGLTRWIHEGQERAQHVR